MIICKDIPKSFSFSLVHGLWLYLITVKCIEHLTEINEIKTEKTFFSSVTGIFFQAKYITLFLKNH